MNTQLDNYYLKQPEPIQGCLLALKDFILSIDKNITHQRKYQIPFFYYKDKKLCFLWIKNKKPLIGFVEDRNIHPRSPGDGRKDKYETLYLDPNEDLPVKVIKKAIKEKIKLYLSLEAVLNLN